ncbi:CidA/LrgA family protein [Allorhizobium pseudoryzae]|uniref:CidA/LrgA family protein n=1 Tax=Allorhizobium pseudoryzae TaxID=379684 RepID=UPI003D0443B5
MLRGLAVLLLFQLVGESLVFLLGVPIPGPVAGLVLLFAALPVLDRLWTREAASIDEAAETLLSNLGLFFVPAGVGVVALANILSAQIWALSAVLILSAIITLLLTVWTFILFRQLIAVRRGS